MDDDYYHLMDHRHGRAAHIGSTLLGLLVVVFLLAAFSGLGYAVYQAVQPSGCQPVMHQGKKACETYNAQDQVIYVPWTYWYYGGYYNGILYGSGGAGSTYSRSYGYSGASDPNSDEGDGDSSYGDYSSTDGSSDDSGFSAGDSSFSDGGD